MTTTTSAVAAPTDTGPDDRGTLTIAGRTVERIAATAVTELEGVGGAASRMLGVVVGGEDPDRTAKVTATVEETTAALDVRLSVIYPNSVRKTTENARAHLTRRVEELTGLRVIRVDIAVTALHTAATDTRRVQ